MYIYIYVYVYICIHIYTTTTKENSSLYRDWETNLSPYTQSRHFSKHFLITGKRQ